MRLERRTAALDTPHPPLGTDMNRAEALHALQELTRDLAKLERTWADIVTAVMELEFVQGTDRGLKSLRRE